MPLQPQELCLQEPWVPDRQGSWQVQPCWIGWRESGQTKAIPVVIDTSD